MGLGYGTGRGRTPLYRKRKPLPALIVLAVLSLVAVGVWISALDGSVDRNEAVKCPPPEELPEGSELSSLPFDALDNTTPATPGNAKIQVLNAGSQRGQAAITTETLRGHGFDQISQPGNDELYPEQNMDCRGQIRFGENGAATARLLSLLEPCAELVRTNRPDAAVELSIGERFDDLRPKAEGLEAIEALREWEKSHPNQGSAEQSAGDGGPSIDQAKLAAARDLTC
ncbi:LytR cell envelope-related transcriptional attenuator [Tamaricihabitans halophyticus]|uniref:LytR cell envelope-related transcriptional attenuator n=1 Tax=Tamaricihabitans halophyticus TaxID=1262583 RepID=A0A4R2QZT3_9PSEU|nr:envelope integrity protein Cei [Tamaricihabitans halophyticus]TCP55217.1 LytR cell envelope-related transcriptional attenuator [Tamaricihabitans halophyticus]